MKIKTLRSGIAIDEKEFKKWLKALREGNYKQGVGFLNYQNTFCCLGVACDVIIPEKKQEHCTHGLFGEVPDDQAHAPEWLKGISEDVRHRFNGGSTTKSMKLGKEGESPYIEASLVDINDGKYMNFQEISDALELCYVHGVFE